MEQPAQRIPEALLDEPLAGTGLHTDARGSPTLRAQLDAARPTMLLFLRHLGCIFSREMVKDVRIASDRADATANGGGGEKRYPRVLFVHQGTPEQGARFFGRYWPGAPAISDPPKRLYDAMGLGRASLGQLLGPRAWVCALRATFKGHSQGRTVGDPWMMPGLFLVSPDGRILHSHRFAHAGDHPDFARYADAESFESRDAMAAAQADALPQTA